MDVTLESIEQVLNRLAQLRVLTRLTKEDDTGIVQSMLVVEHMKSLLTTRQEMPFVIKQPYGFGFFKRNIEIKFRVWWEPLTKRNGIVVEHFRF